MVSFYCRFFFFKQKTAYEMRISDWSSDVCSSDLLAIPKLDRLIFVATHTFAPDRLATAVNAPLQLGPDKALLARAPLTHGDGNRWLHMASLPDHRTAELWAHGKAGATVPPDSARVAAARQAGAGCGTGRRCKYLRRFSVT